MLLLLLLQVVKAYQYTSLTSVTLLVSVLSLALCMAQHHAVLQQSTS